MKILFKKADGEDVEIEIEITAEGGLKYVTDPDKKIADPNHTACNKAAKAMEDRLQAILKRKISETDNALVKVEETTPVQKQFIQEVETQTQGLSGEGQE